MIKKMLVVFMATLFMSACAGPLTCKQKADTFHLVNQSAVNAVEIYAVPKMGEFGPQWADVTYKVLDLAKREYLKKCLEKEKAMEPPLPEGH